MEDNTNSFTTISLADGNVWISEAYGDSWSYNSDCDTSSATLKLKGGGSSYRSLVYQCVLAWLRNKLGQYIMINGKLEFAPCLCGLPLFSVKMTSQDNPYFFDIDCEFKFQDKENSESINEETYEMPDIAEDEYSFSISLEEDTRMYSLKTLASVPLCSQRPAKNLGGALNPDKETGEPQGLSVQVPTVDIEVSVSLPCWWFTREYRNALANCVGCINKYEYDGFGAHNLLFKGFTARPETMTFTNQEGNEVKEWYWRATYSFQAKRSEYFNYAIDGTETADYVEITKAGWDAVTIITSRTPTGHKGGTIVSPVQLNLEQIYPEIDFDAILMLPVKGSKCRRTVPNEYRSAQACKYIGGAQ